MKSLDGRRPLKARNTKIANNIAHWLSQKNITPNQISIASMVFAIFASICLILLPNQSPTLPILAAIFIHCRLLCNLLDGMVAVEGGKKSASGELFNDIPDRFADCVILIAAGYAINFVDWADIVGWCAGLLAVMTAYIRVLATSVGAPTNFQGPMAKQHRMAAMTMACILNTLDPQGHMMLIALLLIVAGSAITTYRRIISAYKFLENNA